MTVRLTRAERKAATRARLVEAAGLDFIAHGYDAVGLRDIAQHAGLSTGAIFANFTSKHDLLEAVLEAYAGDPLDRAAWALFFHGHHAAADLVRSLDRSAAA
jgi:AcrR family transcriptional regulator